MNSKNVDSMGWRWVAGRFEGDRAKSVIAHAATGNYQVLQQGKQGNMVWCIAAFRRPVDDALPDHLTIISDPEKIAKLEQLFDVMHGYVEHPAGQQETIDGYPAKERLRQWFKNRKTAKVDRKEVAEELQDL